MSEREMEELRKELMEVRLSIFNLLEILNKLYIVFLKWIDICGPSVALKNDYVFADPHGTWDGHLDGAYAEGDWIKTILENEDHNVGMKRHPVSKAEFLNNVTSKYIVHLAGHGSYSSGECYFCFDDGNIYPSDISGLSSVPSKLFYAGVCLCGSNNTMANAFINKGTDMYVGFSTTIPDMGAAEFDKLVYEKWLVDGKTLRTALDEADDLYPGCNSWVLWGD